MDSWFDIESEELSKMAVVYHKHGKMRQAENAYKLVIQIRKKNGDFDSIGLALTHHRLASLYQQLGHHTMAVAELEEAVRLYSVHHTDDPSSIAWEREALKTLLTSRNLVVDLDQFRTDAA